MPGALDALNAVMRLPDTVQTVVTGTIRSNAKAKLAAFGLDSCLDLSIGGYGSENYPKASLIQFTRMRAEEAYGRAFPESRTVYITESARDVEAARIGRVEPIAVVSGSSTESQLRAAGAELILADLTDPAAVVAASAPRRVRTEDPGDEENPRNSPRNGTPRGTVREWI